ncbi:MAG: uroporphyrinogen-III C-methyltransferase [Alphaproteobacteria bacterium]
MDHLPIFLDVKGKKVIVDGGGTLAARRVERALDAGALVHVYAEELGGEFRELKNHPSLTHHTQAPRLPDFIGAAVAYGATEDEERDRHLYDMANHNHVLANVADVTEYCDFITPSIIDRSPLVIAISSGGAAPIIARILRARIEAILPAAYGKLAAFSGRLRERVMTKLKTPESRRMFWENTIDGPVADTFLAGDSKGAKKQFLKELDAAALDGIINLVRRDAERIFVGKSPNNHAMDQQEISDLMVKLAKDGKRVLRLKGGDPFIFGRGGEELETLAAADVPFQVIPGITAASGCASYAGIPLTHRDHAQSCVFVTAHGRDGVLSLDWETMARPGQTVAIYMGRSSLDFLMEEFIRRGVDPNTPAAIVDNGTRPNQQVVKGTISNLYEKAEAAKLPGPALVIVGSVVELSDTLNWYKNYEADKHTMSLSASVEL